jgi:thiosulfate dehydrogenase [quinone] large subunit
VSPDRPTTAALTRWQQAALVLMRVGIGWHLFFQGYGKLQTAGWTARGYLQSATGPLAAAFHALAANPSALRLADAATVWGLMILGLLLMIGLCSRAAAVGGLLLVALFYAAMPPLSYGFIIPTFEGTDLWVNKNLVECLGLLVVASFPTGLIAGLDILVRHWLDARRHPAASADSARGEQRT